MKRVLQFSKLNTDLDCNNFNLVGVNALDPIPSDVVGSSDTRLTDKRMPVDGSVTDAKVSKVANIDQSKLNLNGTMPAAWIGNTKTQAAQGNLVERVAGKGAASGYVPLDANGRVPSSFLASTGPGAGTVTYVDLSVPNEFAISGGPVTAGAGTLAVTLSNEPDKSWFGTNGPVGMLTPVVVSSPGPQGVVVLPNTGYGGAIDTGMLARSDIDGIKVGDFWYDVNPSDGGFDWTVLDNYVALIEPTGKFFGFEIGCAHGYQTLSPTPGDIPDWLAAAVGANTIEFLDPGSGDHIVTPVTWNPDYIAKKIAMYAAMGARYSSHPLLKYVTVGYTDYVTEDWTMPHSNTVDGYNPPGSSQVSRLIALGYTDATLIAAGVQIISAVADAFPNQVIQILTNTLSGLEASSNFITDSVISQLRALYGSRIYVSVFSVSNFMVTDPPPSNAKNWGMHLAKPSVSGQALFKCFGDSLYRMNLGVPGDPATILMGSADRFATYVGQFYEVWYLDCLHLTTATEYIHSILVNVPVSGIRPSFLTKQIPLGLVPNLSGGKFTSGLFDLARLPVMSGIGIGHVKGMVPDPGDGKTGDATDYLARDGTWKQFSTIAPYQPAVPNPNIFIGPISSNGKVAVTIRSMLRGSSLFYKVIPGSFIVATSRDVHLQLDQGTKIQAYGAKPGYNNSDLVTYVVTTNAVA